MDCWTEAARRSSTLQPVRVTLKWAECHQVEVEKKFLTVLINHSGQTFCVKRHAPLIHVTEMELAQRLVWKKSHQIGWIWLLGRPAWHRWLGQFVSAHSQEMIWILFTLWASKQRDEVTVASKSFCSDCSDVLPGCNKHQSAASLHVWTGIFAYSAARQCAYMGRGSICEDLNWIYVNTESDISEVKEGKTC